LTRGKVKKALLATLVLVVALAGLALVIPFDAPGIGREVSERVRSATGIELQIARSRVRLLRGVVLEDVRFSAGSYRGQFPRIVLEREARGIRIEEGRIDFDGGPVVVEGLALVLSRLDSDPRAITKLHGLSIEGDLTVRAIAVDRRAVRGVAARISTSNGRFQIQDLRLTTGRGEVSGELALDFNSIPFRYRASLLGPSIEVKGFGQGALRLDAEGFGTKARNLKGKGTFALERGRLPDAGWVREIDPALAGAEHAPVEIPFEMRDERVYFERFEIEATEKTLALDGSFGLDRSRDLRATVNRRRD
jgi:hypothetical protein